MTTSINDPILFFAVMVSATLLAPLISEKTKVPDIVLLLLAGAVMGPYGLGWLERNSAVMLFGSVGLIYIMFLAGLEIDLHRFIVASRKSVIFGLLTFAIPQCIGTLLGHYVLSMEWPAAILLASMFASHTLLAYPVASSLGIARSEPVAVAVGATIITDTLALLVLAVVADAAKGIELNVAFWFTIGTGIVLLSAISLWGIPWLSRWFFRHAGEDGSAQFLFVVGIVCLLAFMSHFARMEPIIGAFLAGIAFNRLIPEQSTLMNRVEFVGKTLFIPFFLISVGMLVNFGGLISDPRSWFVAGLMVCAVILTKYMAAHLACIFCGYTRVEGNVMFGLSVVQAAATLAAVLVGYELDIFDETVLNGAIAMIMVTCPLGSWSVDRYGRYMVAETLYVDLPRRMEQRILVPVVNSHTATRLLDLSFMLRELAPSAVVHPLVVVSDEDEERGALAEGEKLIASCVAHAASLEVPVQPTVRIEMNASDGIIRAAKEIHADTVLIGWSGEDTVATRVFGSVRKKMLQECPARLYIARLVLPLNTTRRILMPLPPQSERRSDIRRLLEEAKRLSRQMGAALHVYLCDPIAAPQIKALIDKIPPEMPVVIHEKREWSAVRRQLLKDIVKDDMALLPVERRRGAFWTPSMDRLPDVIIEAFPQMNLIAAYPAFVDRVQQAGAMYDSTPSTGSVIPVDLVQTFSVEDAIRKIVSACGVMDKGQQQNLYNHLFDSASTYPVEMAPGVVLLHAHCKEIGNITLLVGAGEPKWVFPSINTPVRIVLALISPIDEPPESHLAVLSHLARVFHDRQFVEKVLTGDSSAEVADLMAEFIAPVFQR